MQKARLVSSHLIGENKASIIRPPKAGSGKKALPKKLFAGVTMWQEHYKQIPRSETKKRIKFLAKTITQADELIKLAKQNLLTHVAAEFEADKAKMLAIKARLEFAVANAKKA